MFAFPNKLLLKPGEDIEMFKGHVNPKNVHFLFT